jgi:phosphate transport system permease protein
LKSKNSQNTGKTAHTRAVFFDKAARVVINLGGVGIIIAVLGILLFIVLEALPLFYSASGEEVFIHRKTEQKGILLAGMDEYQEVAYAITDSGNVDFIDLMGKRLMMQHHFYELENRIIKTAATDIYGKNFVLGLDSGLVATFQINFNVTFDENDNRIINPEVIFDSIIKLDTLNRSANKISYINNGEGQFTIVASYGDDLIYYSVEEEHSLFGAGEKTEYRTNLLQYVNGVSNLFELDSDALQLAVVSKSELILFDIRDKNEPKVIQRISTKGKKADITALKYLLGNQTLIIGDSEGNVYSIMKINDKDSEYGWKFVETHIFSPHKFPISYIAVSTRDKTFLTGDRGGKIHLNYLTNAKLLLELEDTDIPVKMISYSPKSDGAIILFEDGVFSQYVFDDPHPDVSIKILFGKVWYEGYKQPEYVWQSTGGSDSFEPKFSLIPLIFGTLKGTLYAMLFAIPLAILGALYTSTFSHPKLRNKIKPVVELMAALPSVVIGFLAGIWLAPVLEDILPGVFLMFLILPLIIILAVFVRKKITKLDKKLTPGYEVVFVIPFLLLGVFLSIQLGPLFESIFLGGDYRIWISDFLNTDYDQRNSLVVGFAMGFAVIPIIFTICEDALSSVPQHLTSASLALGANKWQTAVRVVLPTASPGIFSAIMIGFGRAIGETMIVLMATGNTPILSFSPFNGMRTLSANIAVEIPEAPYQGTLYRILFLSAALLFVLTFVVNTVAEIVRQRLRKKYMHI